MIDYSDAHHRYFWKLFAPDARVYTEMIHANAILFGKKESILSFDPSEHPIALQLGGNDPQRLAESASLAQRWGYDEINLNIGCPSDRVQQGQFGACLMREPGLVADCVRAIREHSHLPVTIKTRIGIDHYDSYEFLRDFVGVVSEAGVKVFIIHARKAWLKGLSPKQNREIPPLQYDRVQQIKKDFSHLTIVINGGITSLEQVQSQLAVLDGVMIGREICTRPYFLAELSAFLFNRPIPLPGQILESYLHYVEKCPQSTLNYRLILRPLMGLCFATSEAKRWRHTIAHASLDAMPPEAILKFYKSIQPS